MTTKNLFLDKQWQSAHLKKVKERAGDRYSPELNVDLPIADIFDGISRTENFYISIRSHYGKLNREFKRVSSKFENLELQEIYDAIRREISQLLKLLSKLKEYNTNEIPWEEVNKISLQVKILVWKFTEQLAEDQKQRNVEEPKTEHNPETQRPSSETTGFDIHHMYETQNELDYFEEFSSITKSKLSNSPFLLITGDAGTGKTHLLCDVIENRYSGRQSLPAVLAFGELFTTTEDPFVQIILQLGLRLSKTQFLRQLNTAGKQSGCRAIIAIDALNETGERNFWKRNLSKVGNEIKKYPNVALVVSVRTGFEEEVLSKKAKRDFVHQEHRGFEFREWEAVSKFFHKFHLPLPEIPLLMPEFQNPLFLLLFCKAFQNRTKTNRGKNQKQTFRGHEGATYIFEEFVDSVSRKIFKEFKLANRVKDNIWDAVIKQIAAEMVEQNDDRISEDRVVYLVRNAYPSIDHAHFIKELERNSLLVKVPRFSTGKAQYDGFDFRFPFQKFSDHLLGRYIFKKYELEFGKTNKNITTARIFFSKRRKLGKFLSGSLKSRGIIEALSIQCPEHLRGLEFIEVAPYLKSSRAGQRAFVESLIWRKPTAFSEDRRNTLAYINAEIVITDSGNTSLLNAFLSIAPIPNHPFNADYLHRHLSKLSMANRDSWWSTFLHYEYGEKGAVDRLIEWGWSEQDKTCIDDDAVRLSCVALLWFLATPNRFVRDKSTKALVGLLTNRLNVLLKLLEQFQDVNDPYISERLYAVAYGCALRSRKDRDGLRTLSKWVYTNIFQSGTPPADVLLRDCARGIITVALREGIQLKINRNKIDPPYNSQFPKKLPSNRTIKKYEFDYKNKDLKDYLWAQNSIIRSMQPEYSEMSDFSYGDFGRYTFEDALSHYRYPKNITIQKLSNWATKRVFDLGYDVHLHGEFDTNIERYHNSGRSEHKAERIGKKYQWIALHELLARISDNFEFSDERFPGEIGRYEGPWSLNVRDIDPSCVLKDFPNARAKLLPKFNEYEKRNRYNAWGKNDPKISWLKKTRDLPDPRQIIELVDDQGITWIALDKNVDWKEEVSPELDKYNLQTRNLWYMIKCYLVEEKDIEKVFNWAKKRHFKTRSMPESHEFYNVFLGEYPWASSYLHLETPYDHHLGWTDGEWNEKIPAKILVTDDEYSSSGSSIDCSISRPIKIKLPAKFIADEMNLVQNNMDGRFIDKKGDLVAFDPGVFDTKMTGQILIRKDKLCAFLKRKGFAIFWTLVGEKYVINGDVIKQPLGRLEVSGAYTLGNDGKQIIGVKRSSFKSYDS